MRVLFLKMKKKKSRESNNKYFKDYLLHQNCYSEFFLKIQFITLIFKKCRNGGYKLFNNMEEEKQLIFLKKGKRQALKNFRDNS